MYGQKKSIKKMSGKVMKNDAKKMSVKKIAKMKKMGKKK
jgi:hypothetical protein